MTTLTGITPLTALAGEPSMIRVMTAAAASLPSITYRDITLPDGTISHVLHEAGHVGPQHFAFMPVIRSDAAGQGFVLEDGSGSTSGRLMAHWMFRGIRWQGMYWFSGDGGAGNDPLNTIFNGPRPDQPHHIVFTQCAADGDPLDTGDHCARVALIDCAYFAWVNGYITNYSSSKGGEVYLFWGTGEGEGPLHFENNEFRIPQTFALFLGGGGSNCVGVVPSDIVYRRNWHYCPTEWRKSELNPYNGGDPSTGYAGQDGHLVTVAANGTQVDRVAGAGNFSWDAETDNAPNTDCIMYEPATGIARLLASNNSGQGGALPHRITLATAWPGTLPTQIRVYFQWAFPNVRYNSGTVVGAMPTATTVIGSTAVTFSATLPVSVEVGHFFYLNNTWHGGPRTTNDNVAARAFDTGWGVGDDQAGNTYPALAVARSACRRKKIVAIAADRLSCTLESAYFESRTFPYSVVVHDGQWRRIRSKSFIEIKTGQRMLVEGNVFDYVVGGATLHPTDQGNPLHDLGTLTITGDTATASNGWSARTDALGRQRAAYGPQWPYRVVVAGTWSDGFFNTREVIRVEGGIAQLRPVNPAWVISQQPTSYTGIYGIFECSTPWWHLSHHMWRYNIIRSLHYAGPSWFTGNENPGEITKGQRLLVHDNLYLEVGDKSKFGFGLPLRLGGSFPFQTSLPRPGQPEDNSSGSLSYRHNATVHNSVHSNTKIFHGYSFLLPSPNIVIKSKDIELNDNIFTDMSAGPFGIISAEVSGAVDTAPWSEAPFTVARNVFAGSVAPAAVATGLFATPFPDNSGVSATDRVGFIDYDGADPTNPANYRVVDIFTTGTVTIAANGLSATLASGVFPATVVPGQFFRTATLPTELRKITNGGNGTATVTWMGVAHGEAGQSGKSYAITFKGTATDGTDPGPNIPLLQDFTQGVVTHAP